MSEISDFLDYHYDFGFVISLSLYLWCADLIAHAKFSDELHFRFSAARSNFAMRSPLSFFFSCYHWRISI